MTPAIIQSVRRRFFEQIREATTRGHIEEALAALEKSQVLAWRPVGNDPSNYSSIAINASALSAGLERIINAIDATLERKVWDHPQWASLRSPRELVQEAFGVANGQLKGLKVGALQALAQKAQVAVRIDKGDAPDVCTFEVVDAGTGIHPDRFAHTILSIHAGNKLNRWYVVGMYGHGGSSTFNFCDYTVIASRAQPSAEDPTPPVGLTVVRYSEGAEDDKMGFFEYLVDELGQVIQMQVPADEFAAGTCVRHINFQRPAGQAAVQWYEDMAFVAFDPVLPFRLEHRPSGENRNNFGSRHKLDNSGLVEARGEYTALLGPQGSYGTVGIRWWLVNEKKAVKNFCEPTTPVVLTFHGQKHATISRSALSECKMPYTCQSLVVQVDLDQISNVGRRSLLTANREQTREEGLAEIRRLVVDTIRDDATLREFERERRDELISQGTTKNREEMRRHLAEMLNRIKPGSVKVPLKGQKKGRGKRGARSGNSNAQPLQTRDFPTYLKVGNKPDPIPVEVGRQARLELQSDAPTDFLAKTGSSLIVDLAPGLKENKRGADFVGGRLNVWISFEEDEPVGTVVDIPIVLAARKPNGHEVRLETVRTVELKPAKTTHGNSASEIDAPRIVEVGPNVPDAAARRWYADQGWSTDHVALVNLGQDSEEIYINVENRWLLGILEGITKTPEFIERIKTRFVLHVAFHSYLQASAFQRKIERGDNPDYLAGQEELDRVARTVATAITAATTLDDNASGLD